MQTIAAAAALRYDPIATYMCQGKSRRKNCLLLHAAEAARPSLLIHFLTVEKSRWVDRNIYKGQQTIDS